MSRHARYSQLHFHLLPASQPARAAAVAPRPLQALGPHVSPLGVLHWAAPADGEARAWPAEYDNSIFVAEHG